MAYGIMFILIVPFVFFVMNVIFQRYHFSTTNYKGLYVPYSGGFTLIIMMCIDFLFFSFTVTTYASIVFLIFIWGLGFVDDRYGTSYPKGLKGHFSYAFNKRTYTTGLYKAVGTVVASFFYVSLMPQGTVAMVLLIYFFLLIFTPHVMNLMDTKPLRVWKLLFLLILIFHPFLTAGMDFIYALGVVLFSWFVFEGRMKMMLGDNGAMLVGGWLALLAIHNWSIGAQIILLMFCLLMTIISERTSIQAWIVKTPIINGVDKWGRVN
ncbi:hypothetical protein LGQ02_07675 [Bacillus shivajii]|uniref:hypothetical protein n=1 Tax=Bacillus shivajii TaxID=1983719 RepID=UPI001CFBA823|nr:hypothetical protein [Bacillus shivajii]UCZ54621.1 hypothetical protein LGQ02_07675 [Bacillus shivajii]